LIGYSESLPGRNAGPITAAERLLSLDALRGVAVMGILVMNVYAFAMPFAAYYNPLIMGGTDALNMGTWFFTHLFFDQKFMSIFSMLYGAGVVMMMNRAAERGASFTPVFYRRSAWLMVIGLLHGYFIWFGDILFHYALMGMVVFLFRKASPRKLITIACLLLPVTLLINYGSSFYLEELQADVAAIEEAQSQGATLDEDEREKLEEWRDVRPIFAPTGEDIAAEVTAYKGSYVDVLAHRAPFVAFMQVSGTLVFVVWRVGGLMLLGMALMKLGVLSGERNTRFYKRMTLFGYGVGLPLAVLSAVTLEGQQFDPLYVARYGGIPNYFGSILVAFGHIGAVMLVVKSGAFEAVVGRFAAVGRTALSNYLAHSLVMTSLFYGYGMGLYGEVPRFAQQGFVVALVGLQLLLSPWWLRHFRFGPAEWLWRSLTYGQRQPMRR
jgi:uncharacterized protein